MSLKESLTWRYAVKKYNNQKVSDEAIQTILDAINLSASSTGMQPYRVIVVKDAAIREELAKDSFNAQILEASDLLVFAAFETITQANIDDYMAHVAAVREMPLEQLSGFKQALETHMLTQTPEANFSWAARQAYIGLGTGLIAAAELKIDTTPMEGFNHEKLDQLLGLPAKGLKSVVLLSLGYRDAEQDPYANLKKVRLPLEEFAFVQ
ncbi:NAD(P)H-dependent oxidoreductase [Siphonobacter sp. BAB-5405]|uniref:NAD(P)H-dependent oxidoreductase n=1 Tax=Siphonobacter sp. BAB-5405 TaxID=1864825 RepID=UPI000C7FB54E|nr:NAD(P)H-dependent oxidoreductase [Siphonobacter sp. BAB-5405]PMD92330.1 NAD(P)H-dependent oxidoreductase [Siphonobacter sp. BAB-5405]